MSDLQIIFLLTYFSEPLRTNINIALTGHRNKLFITVTSKPHLKFLAHVLKYPNQKPPTERKRSTRDFKDETLIIEPAWKING